MIYPGRRELMAWTRLHLDSHSTTPLRINPNIFRLRLIVIIVSTGSLREQNPFGRRRMKRDRLACARHR